MATESTSVIPVNIFSKLVTSRSKCRTPALRQSINASRTALRRNSLFGFQQPLFQQPLQSRVKGALLDLQQVIRSLLDVLDQRIPMHRFQPKRMQDHQVQSTREKIAAFRVLCHDRQYRRWIPILQIVLRRLTNRPPDVSFANTYARPIRLPKSSSVAGKVILLQQCAPSGDERDCKAFS